MSVYHFVTSVTSPHYLPEPTQWPDENSRFFSIAPYSKDLPKDIRGTIENIAEQWFPSNILGAIAYGAEVPMPQERENSLLTKDESEARGHGTPRSRTSYSGEIWGWFDVGHR
jgi:hypothetical protein